MTTRPLMFLAALTLTAACTDSTGTGAGARPSGVGTEFMRAQDLDGTPDLLVDAHRLAVSWVVYDEILPAGVCSVEEGGVTPGMHRTLRFTVTTPNVGDADVFIGNPLDHVDPNHDGNYSDSDGLFEFASCHNHFHFRHYATYQLISVADGHVWRAAKRGFCMIDVTPWNSGSGGVTPWLYRSCGTKTLPGFQGISVGYADTYNKHLGGQYFVLDGGDSQDPIPPGDYLIRITVNPPFAPTAGDVCPHLDTHGMCHMLPESNYDNNVAEIRITIPDHPGKTGFGPGADNQAGTEILDDENRPDKP